MIQEYTVSEARKNLPSLLKHLQKNAGLSFLIRVRNEAVARLVSAKKSSGEGRAVRALLKLSGRQRKSKIGLPYSENFKDFLYGRHKSR